ncbi:BnaUnng01110D [Brassica napus]|uniref:BnaUnng01110D protein n=1 Tax=Brassica napus TaxID=3708 RepID=A0A078JI51_BRANA|nr:BnaUnng01110D [Brassica napus]
MPLPGFSSTWRTAGKLRRVLHFLHVIEQLLGLPVDRREISFLVSEEALDRCSIRGVISAPRGAEALEEYKRALEVTAARKAAIHWVVPAGAVIFSLPEVALASLNSEVFPMTPTRPSLDEDTSKVVRSLQGDVLQVASQLFHLKGRMKDRSATKAERDALAIRLREEKDAILAKDEEIEAWKIRVQYLDEERERLEAEDVSLQRQLEDKEEEICELRYAAEVFDAEKIKAVNDAKVVVRWELMREWLDDQTDRWDPITSFEQYKVVKISEAEFLGLPPPSFEYKP